MVKIPPRKRRIARAQAQALAAEREREREAEREAERVAKRAKREEKENGEQEEVDLASVPRFEGGAHHHRNHYDLGSHAPQAAAPSSGVPPLEMRSPMKLFLNTQKPKMTPRERFKVYHPAMVEDVMRPGRIPRIIYAGDCGIPAVFVVCFAKTSPYTGHETGVLSTYNTVEAGAVGALERGVSEGSVMRGRWLGRLLRGDSRIAEPWIGS
ncbi:hypothetical protein F5B19DRAFT_464335 [Rostrohypoxylon terebratum]|nr:hypothetical protein F5B19DRAFT_464335 [Rostrohypoxylon terebratum]